MILGLCLWGVDPALALPWMTVRRLHFRRGCQNIFAHSDAIQFDVCAHKTTDLDLLIASACLDLMQAPDIEINLQNLQKYFQFL